MNKRVEIRVTGRVQGVAFRWHTQQQARALNLVGSVRNLADGSVRIVAEGEPAAVEAMLIWAGRGPAHAVVESCVADWGPATDRDVDFIITG